MGRRRGSGDTPRPLPRTLHDNTYSFPATALIVRFPLQPRCRRRCGGSGRAQAPRARSSARSGAAWARSRSCASGRSSSRTASTGAGRPPLPPRPHHRRQRRPASPRPRPGARRLLLRLLRQARAEAERRRGRAGPRRARAAEVPRRTARFRSQSDRRIAMRNRRRGCDKKGVVSALPLAARRTLLLLGSLFVPRCAVLRSALCPEAWSSAELRCCRCQAVPRAARARLPPSPLALGART